MSSLFRVIWCFSSVAILPNWGKAFFFKKLWPSAPTPPMAPLPVPVHPPIAPIPVPPPPLLPPGAEARPTTRSPTTTAPRGSVTSNRCRSSSSGTAPTPWPCGPTYAALASVKWSATTASEPPARGRWPGRPSPPRTGGRPRCTHRRGGADPVPLLHQGHAGASQGACRHCTVLAESPSLVLDNWWNPSTNLYTKCV